eukprot:scaffold77236_cov39-Tisochrysis_lutea.AAC.1
MREAKNGEVNQCNTCAYGENVCYYDVARASRTAVANRLMPSSISDASSRAKHRRTYRSNVPGGQLGAHARPGRKTTPYRSAIGSKRSALRPCGRRTHAKKPPEGSATSSSSPALFFRARTNTSHERQ